MLTSNKVLLPGLSCLDKLGTLKVKPLIRYLPSGLFGFNTNIQGVT